jgi:protein gp37
MIAETPWLDWLLLTKRPDGWADRLHEVVQNNHDGGDMLASQWLDGDAPANVWIGTSVENQAAADERIPHLLNIPAKVRFLSMEPLLGPVNLTGFASPLWGRLPANQFISWVIVGGESGHNARPVHPGWVRSLRDQCQGAGVPFFFKQWGEWLDQDCMTAAQYEIAAVLDPESIGGVRRYKRDGFLFPTHDSLVFRIGKKNAGRLLDGVEWGQFPGAL